MSLYRELYQVAYNGGKFKIDLIKKSLWINKKQIIKEGVIVYEQNKSKELIEKHDLVDLLENLIIEDLQEYPWGNIEMLYQLFKHSVPRENDNKSYFKALSVDELSDKELAFNYNRNFTQALLEGYILLAGMQGWLTWDYDKFWFWKGQDEDLIVLKNMITN